MITELSLAEISSSFLAGVHSPTLKDHSMLGVLLIENIKKYIDPQLQVVNPSSLKTNQKVIN